MRSDPIPSSVEPGEPRLVFACSGQRLLLGDCADVVPCLPEAKVALVYVDPPFGTGRAQPYRFGLATAQQAYPDPSGRGSWWSRWHPRLRGMFDRLRPGGILVLHLDPRTAPLARVRLDEMLGGDAFLNEIVWHYRTGGIARDRLPSKHDTLLVYRKGGGHTFHQLREKRYLAHRASRRGVEEHRDARGWYRYARMDDVWAIPAVTADARERLGYPTQKPEALLARLLDTFTNPGDTVVDLTCGSGTTLAAAQRAGRMWIAGDEDERAILCSLGRIVRMLSPDFAKAWDRCGVAERKGDLAARIARHRAEPGSWGLADEEREFLSGLPSVALGAPRG